MKIDLSFEHIIHLQNMITLIKFSYKLVNFKFIMSLCLLPFPHFDNDAAFIVAQSHIVGAPETGHTPHSLHAIVQCALKAVSARVPDTHGPCRGRENTV